MKDQIVWSDDLLINDPTVDEDHRKLFALMSEIGSSATHGRETIQWAIDFLLVYCKEHFVAEELSMALTEYPGLDEHKKDHDYLISKLHEVISPAILSEPGEVGESFCVNMTDWLSEHVMTWDMKYAGYLRQAKRTDRRIELV